MERMAERPASQLLTLLEDLRQGDDHLLSFIDLLEARFSAREVDVRAFVPEPKRFDRLRREARELIEQHPDPQDRPPLFGLPIGVKDIFHAQGFLTRAGSRVPPEELHGLEAECVSSLKAAGALILGKTVSTEFAYFAPGPTRNPRNLEHTPGGSSSGSAAAVGAGLCPLALGTQTIGSVCRPAAYCGVVGFKPSYDRISRSGLIPLAPSFDHVGLFAAAVPGLELLAKLLCRGWKPVEMDPRPVLGLPEGPYLERADDEGKVHLQQVCERLEDAGYPVKRLPVMADFDEIEARHRLVLAAEVARVHRPWFGRFGELYHEKTAELVQRGEVVDAEALQKALVACRRLRGQLVGAMEEAEIDLWITPAAPGAAPAGLDSTGDPVMNLPWSQAGLPSLSLPAGRNAQRLPLGLQAIGRWWADESLLLWGAQLAETVG